MHFNFACAVACLFAVSALAVPVEVQKKVVVVRSDACPAPGPSMPNYQPHPAQPNPPAPEVSNPSAQQATTVNNNQCAAGTSVHCCDTVDSTDNSNVLNQLTAAGIDHQEAKQKGQVGLTCTPITTSLVDALNGNVCQGATTACCENNDQTGLVNLNLGCTVIPVTL